MNKESLLSAFLAVILIGGLVLASAMRFGTVQASTGVSGIPKPSVPEFTIKLVDSSYDVPATYSRDPYTGEEVLVEPAHRVNNGTIELWITNQQYAYSNGSTFHVFYSVQTKGHYEETWFFATPKLGNQLLSSDSNEEGVFIKNIPHQSDSKYTVLSFSAVYPPTYPDYTRRAYDPGSQVDFQVQAVIGHESKYFVPNPWLQLQPPYIGYYEAGIIFDTASDWSETQTVIISDGQKPQTPQKEQDIIIVAVIAAAVLGAALGLLIYFEKRKR